MSIETRLGKLEAEIKPVSGCASCSRLATLGPASGRTHKLTCPTCGKVSYCYPYLDALELTDAELEAIVEGWEC